MSTKRKAGWLLGICALLVGEALYAEPIVEPLQEIVRQTVDADPRVGKFVAELQEAREHVTEALGGGLPKIYLKGELGKVRSADEIAGLQEEHVVGLEWRQRLWDRGGLEARVALARKGVEASLHRLHRVKNEVGFEWVEAWLRWVYESQVMEMYEAFHANMQHQLISVEEKNRAGIGRITDVRLVRARLFQAKARLYEAEVSLQHARQKLNKLTGEEGAPLWLKQWPVIEQWPLPNEVEDEQLLIGLSRYQESLAELYMAHYQRDEVRSEQGATLDLQADIERGRLGGGGGSGECAAVVQNPSLPGGSSAFT